MAWNINGSDRNKQVVDDAKKKLDKAWKEAFLYWTRGDAPLI
jgi:hypothetical protein